MDQRTNKVPPGRRDLLEVSIFGYNTYLMSTM